jgi:hypothetical protein
MSFNDTPEINKLNYGRMNTAPAENFVVDLLPLAL